MKRKPLIGAGILALSLSFMTGISIHSSLHETHYEVQAAFNQKCVINDYNLFDHMGEAYPGDTGTATLENGDGKYVLTLDNFSVTGTGFDVFNHDFGPYAGQTYSVIYIRLDKSLTINLKGESNITLSREQEFERNLVTFLFSSNVDFQTDPSEEEKASLNVVVDNVSTGTGTEHVALQSAVYEGDATFTNCVVTGNANSYSKTGGGIFFWNRATINDGAVITGYGGHANVNDDNGLLYSFGIGGADITVNGGEVRGYGREVTGHSSSYTGYSCGLWVNNYTQNGGTAYFEGDKSTSTNSFSAGVITYNYDNKLVIKDGKFTAKGYDQNSSYGIYDENNSNYVIIYDADEFLAKGNKQAILGRMANLVPGVGTDSAGTKHVIDAAYDYRVFDDYTSIFFGVIPHDHSWSYVANGASITASCSAEDCPTTEGLTLTLKAPANLTYDGTAKAATFEEGYSTDAFPSPQIKYFKGGSEVTECVNAGDYTAKVTYGNAVAVLDFTIAKANPAPTAVSDRNAVYGQKLSEISLPDGWAWNNPTDKVGNVGTRQHKATFTPEDTTNYNTAEQDVNVIVAKADPDYTVPTGLTCLVNKTLSTVALPAGWSWDEPNTNVGGELGNKVFKGTFTPEDTANYNVVEHVDITVKVSEHEHVWSYTANGASITASCNAPNCDVTTGLTLTLKAPAGDMKYDGNAKVVTFEGGYNPEAFPNPVIKYFKGNAEVNECVDVGKYIAKVTYGNAVAMVEFEILGTKVTDPKNPGVTVEIDNAEVDDNIELRVEVRTDVAEKDIEQDYAKIKQMLENDEQISNVYDVKLVRIVGGVETVIQPADIKPGLVITVRMAIPNGIDVSKARILHIHSADDMEFVNDYSVDGNDLVFKVSKLSEFAFVTKVAAAGGLNGGLIALIVILSVLAALGIIFLLLFFIFAKFIIVYDDEGEQKAVRAIKIGKANEDGKEVLKMLTFKFQKELRPEEEVFKSKQEAEDYISK